VSIPGEVETERLLLRQWTYEDIEPLYEIHQQPDYLATMPAIDLEGTARQVGGWRRRWHDDGFGHWAAIDKATGRLIGRIGLIRHHDWPIGEPPVEVGWTLHRDYWRRGLATEGGRAAIEAWYVGLPADERLLSITLPDNARSQAVMRRLGLTRRGTAHWRDLDVVWWAIDRADWTTPRTSGPRCDPSAATLPERPRSRWAFPRGAG
jgi:RimJ/RimL family protein N-acetyltransferase